MLPGDQARPAKRRRKTGSGSRGSGGVSSKCDTRRPTPRTISTRTPTSGERGSPGPLGAGGEESLETLDIRDPTYIPDDITGADRQKLLDPMRDKAYRDLSEREQALEHGQREFAAVAVLGRYNRRKVLSFPFVKQQLIFQNGPCSTIGEVVDTELNLPGFGLLIIKWAQPEQGYTVLPWAECKNSSRTLRGGGRPNEVGHICYLGGTTGKHVFCMGKEVTAAFIWIEDAETSHHMHKMFADGMTQIAKTMSRSDRVICWSAQVELQFRVARLIDVVENMKLKAESYVKEPRLAKRVTSGRRGGKTRGAGGRGRGGGSRRGRGGRSRTAAGARRGGGGDDDLDYDLDDGLGLEDDLGPAPGRRPQQQQQRRRSQPAPGQRAGGLGLPPPPQQGKSSHSAAYIPWDGHALGSQASEYQAVDPEGDSSGSHWMAGPVPSPRRTAGQDELSLAVSGPGSSAPPHQRAPLSSSSATTATARGGTAQRRQPSPLSGLQTLDDPPDFLNVQDRLPLRLPATGNQDRRPLDWITPPQSNHLAPLKMVGSQRPPVAPVTPPPKPPTKPTAPLQQRPTSVVRAPPLSNTGSTGQTRPLTPAELSRLVQDVVRPHSRALSTSSSPAQPSPGGATPSASPSTPAATPAARPATTTNNNQAAGRPLSGLSAVSGPPPGAADSTVSGAVLGAQVADLLRKVAELTAAQQRTQQQLLETRTEAEKRRSDHSSKDGKDKLQLAQLADVQKQLVRGQAELESGHRQTTASVAAALKRSGEQDMLLATFRADVKTACAKELGSLVERVDLQSAAIHRAQRVVNEVEAMGLEHLREAAIGFQQGLVTLDAWQAFKQEIQGARSRSGGGGESLLDWTGDAQPSLVTDQTQQELSTLQHQHSAQQHLTAKLLEHSSNELVGEVQGKGLLKQLSPVWWIAPGSWAVSAGPQQLHLSQFAWPTRHNATDVFCLGMNAQHQLQLCFTVPEPGAPVTEGDARAEFLRNQAENESADAGWLMRHGLSLLGTKCRAVGLSEDGHSFRQQAFALWLPSGDFALESPEASVQSIETQGRRPSSPLSKRSAINMAVRSLKHVLETNTRLKRFIVRLPHHLLSANEPDATADPAFINGDQASAPQPPASAPRPPPQAAQAPPPQPAAVPTPTTAEPTVSSSRTTELDVATGQAARRPRAKGKRRKKKHRQQQPVQPPQQEGESETAPAPAQAATLSQDQLAPVEEPAFVDDE